MALMRHRQHQQNRGLSGRGFVHDQIIIADMFTSLSGQNFTGRSWVILVIN
ncbi:MAG: hypothetical protein CENE_03159 [Candidatus Celerinatantimonas neptuna]|nr:MAG: hypothetical protein CENE_03159 [Candidatus Celerinatantimonas neptuna]